MMSIGKGWLRRSLLAGVYALGVFGILASGDSGDGDVFRTFTCGLSVRGIAPVGDGTVWVGVFAKTNTDTEDRVVLLDTDGSELLSYLIGNGGSENAIRAVARDALGNIYVGGDFDEGILRLDVNGMLDPTFDPTGTGFNGRVTSIVPLTTGEVYVGGYFTEFGNAPINPVSGLVRLLADGSWDNANFITVGVTNVESIAVGVDLPHVDFVYSGGSGAIPIARWTSSGDLDDVNFNPTPVVVNSVIPAADTTGDIYIGGPFSNGINRLNNTGTPIGGFNMNVGAGFDDDVLSVDRAASGGIYVGGDFTAYDGDNSDGIARINGSGIRDVSFMVGTGFADPNGIFSFSKVASVVQDTSGSDDVFVGGGFTEYNGVPSNGIVRLDTVGSPTAFDVSINIDGEVCDSQTIPDQP